MSFLLKEKIFGLFGVNAKVNDSLKDAFGKGINERYQESIGESYDDELSDLIDNAIENLVVPATMKAELIVLLEVMLGGILTISNLENYRRKIIQFAHTLYNVKGTITGFKIPLFMLGFTGVVIETITYEGTLDSTTSTLDDDIRTLDSEPGCGCGKYRLLLTGSIPLTPEILIAIRNVINFNQPINAELLEILYNDEDIDVELILVYIENGLLFYNNDNDPGITLALNQGVLFKDGINASRYLLIDGKLYYQTS